MANAEMYFVSTYMSP